MESNVAPQIRQPEQSEDSTDCVCMQNRSKTVMGCHVDAELESSKECTCTGRKLQLCLT